MDPHLIFLELLQSELERAVIPDPASDVARSMTTLAARQVRRLIVDRTVLPKLRRVACDAYREILVELRPRISDRCHARLTLALNTADLQDWTSLQEALYDTTVELLSGTDRASCELAGRLAAIDARVREGKENAWVEYSKLKPPASEAATAGGFTNEEEERLLDFIKQHYPKEFGLRIASVKPIPGGFSKQTFFINLDTNLELPASLVMRRDGPHITAGSSVTMEYPLIQKMYAAGVAVAQPFAVDETGEVFGKPFILVSRVPGRNIGDFIKVTEPSRDVALDLAAKMARMHAVPLDGLENILTGVAVPATQRLAADLEKLEVIWKSVVNHDAYVVKVGLDWLKRNIHLAAGPSAVVHNDIGVHNILIHDNKVAAFLDWEMAAIGTPAEDIGYVYYTASQMVDWKDFLAAYERASGVLLNRQQIDYYILWASIRICVMIAGMVDPVFSGKRSSLPEYYLGDYFGHVLFQRVSEKLAELLPISFSPPAASEQI